MRDEVRIPLEHGVSKHLGRAWQVLRVQDMADMSSHPAAIFSDSDFGVFVKLYEGSLAGDQVALELAGLRLLTSRAGVLTPDVIGQINIDDGVLAVMRAVQVIERRNLQWRQIGQALARLHAVKSDRFGLETNGYWGSLYQDNTPLTDWPEFFWERRVSPRLRAAVDSGNLPISLMTEFERLGKRLPALCGSKVEPSLLHGDAHVNNFISTAAGPVMIDPAVYFGHPEVDLAFVDFFSPVPNELLAAYRDIAPLDEGFEHRRDLWRIPAWLAMVQVAGTQYIGQLQAAMRHYV
jgi:fructosamine-3-kinase